MILINRDIFNCLVLAKRRHHGQSGYFRKDSKRLRIEFGNESKGSTKKAEKVSRTMPNVYPANITPDVTGYSA